MHVCCLRNDHMDLQLNRGPILEEPATPSPARNERGSKRTKAEELIDTSTSCSYESLHRLARIRVFCMATEVTYQDTPVKLLHVAVNYFSRLTGMVQLAGRNDWW